MTAESPAINASISRGTARHDALSVLVVDDSEAIRAFMKARLAAIAIDNYDLHIETAISGETAIGAWAASAYDLVFMDVVMPGMGGLEACRQIKAAHQVRVAMVSSLRTPEDHAAAHAAGCDNYLAKPVREADLSAVLRLASLTKRIRR